MEGKGKTAKRKERKLGNEWLSVSTFLKTPVLPTSLISSHGSVKFEPNASR
jgi:hypothetical protein